MQLGQKVNGSYLYRLSIIHLMKYNKNQYNIFDEI